MTERKAEFLLALTTVFWSGTFVFTKYALDSCDPFVFVVLRLMIAVAVGVVLWYSSLRSLSKESVRDGAILGFLYGSGFLLQTWGLQYTSISKSAFITGMVVLFVPGADWLIRRVSVTRIHGIAVLFASVGLVMLTHPDAQAINKGDAMTLCGSLMWAFYISFLDKSSTRHKDVPHFSEHLVLAQFATTVVCGLLILSIRAAFGVSSDTTPSIIPSWSTTLVIALLYTALLGSLASTYIQTKVQRYVPPVKAGIIFTLEPIFASAIAYFSHNERLSTLELSGAIIMIGSIIFADTASLWLRRSAGELRSNSDTQENSSTSIQTDE